MTEYSKKIFVAIKSFLDTEEYHYDLSLIHISCGETGNSAETPC